MRTLGTTQIGAALAIQSRVIVALMLRDPLTKHGHHNLGFFWVIGEPVLLTTGVMVIWTMVGATHGHDVPIAVFALTGYSFITLWRHIVFRSIRAMSATANMKFHQQVKRLDIMVAWTLIETLGVTAGFIISSTAIYLFGVADLMHDPLLTIGGLFLGAWFSCAVGMLLAGLSEISESINHIIQPIMYLTLPLTGIFTMVDWLPPSAQKVMSYSPLANCIEMIRAGIMPIDVPTHYDGMFLLLCCLMVTCVALPVFRFGERFVEA